MFYYLNGTLALVDANLAVIDCGGVGYACHTTNYTLTKLQLGKPAKLFTYCGIKEDAFDIYGFSTREELNCFRQLISVSGVGPKAALAILSVVSPEQFTLAVMTQDVKTLTMAAGVGKKLAQRVLLELKDKIAGSQMELNGADIADMQPAVRGGAGKSRLFSGGDRRGAQGHRRGGAARGGHRAAGAARDGIEVRWGWNEP